MLKRKRQMIAADVRGQRGRGADCRQPAQVPGAERRGNLIAAGRGQRMTDIGLDRGHRPVLNAEKAGYTAENRRFRDPVLRRAGAVCVHDAPAAQRLFTDNRPRAGGGLGHGQVVADPGAGDGFFVAIGIDEHVRRRAEDRRARLHGQLVIEKQQKLRGFAHSEPAVLAKGSAGTPIVWRLVIAQAVQLAQFLIRGQRAHRGVALHDLGGQRRFGRADHRDPRAPLANIVHRVAQVVEKGRTGAQGGAGRSGGAEHIRIDEVRRHLRQPEGTVLRSGPAPAIARLEHAPGAGIVQLPHRAAGIHADRIHRQPGAQLIPVQTQAAQGVAGRVNRQSQTARVVARAVQRRGIEAARRLAGRLDLELPMRGQQKFVLSADLHAHLALLRAGAQLPVLGQGVG